jgi:hypothetical protein
MQNIHGCKETIEPEKLNYETQKDDGVGNRGNIEGTVIGATGTISKSFRKYVSNIPGNHEVKELQKTTILGTAHILRKVLT